MYIIRNSYNAPQTRQLPQSNYLSATLVIFFYELGCVRKEATKKQFLNWWTMILASILLFQKVTPYTVVIDLTYRQFDDFGWWHVSGIP